MSQVVLAALKAIYDTMQFIPCDACWQQMQQFVCCQLHSLREVVSV